MAVLLVEETGLHGEKWFYPSWVPEFTPSFSGVRVSRALALHVVFCRLLLVRLSIKLSVLLQCTDSNSNSNSSNSSYKEQKVKTNIEVAPYLTKTYDSCNRILFVLQNSLFLAQLTHFKMSPLNPLDQIKPVQYMVPGIVLCYDFCSIRNPPPSKQGTSSQIHHIINRQYTYF
jgi:hypothetical protein